MTQPAPIGVGVVGLGFMGRTHVGAYRRAHAAGFANRLVAVCDRDPERRAGRVGSEGNIATAETAGERLFDPAEVQAYEEPEALFRDPGVDLVSICTHTETHVDLAIAALAAGKHVLVEKPVALTSAAAERLAHAARDSTSLCMPALCIRFWPAWSWLRARVVGGEFGAVRSATFRRLSPAPGWTPAFYGDPARTGGALFDLHVHDADFARWCLGDPREVACTGTRDHLTALWRYEAGGPAHVSLEGGWDLTPGAPFRMQFTVVFERATADYASDRDESLLLARDGACEPVQLDDHDGYDGEVRHLLEAVAAGRRDLLASVEDAVGHLRLLEAEQESLRTGSAVHPASAAWR